MDVSCHAYIDEKINASGISHTEIEIEFDRSLLIKDGHTPLTHQLTSHIDSSYENADIIRRFYYNLKTDEVIHALDGMVKYNNLLVARSHMKRYLIYTLLRVTGNYKEMHGLLMNYNVNPACAESTERLYKLYDKAVLLAVRLIEEFSDSVSGTLPFNKMYDYNFGGKYVQDSGNETAENVVEWNRKVI